MKEKIHVAGTRFKVLKVDASDGTYLLEDIYMTGVKSNLIWVRCASTLEQGKYYNGSLSKHPKGQMMKSLPVFTLQS